MTAPSNHSTSTPSAPPADHSTHTSSAAPATSLYHPVLLPRTGTLLPGNIALAPMAGFSDLSFRRICRRHQADLCVTELASARGIRFNGVGGANFRYLEIAPDERPVFIQLFGFDPEDFTIATRAILDHPLLSNCDGIDINMGCPVKKVTQTGAGSALMKTPELAASIVSAVRAVCDEVGKPVSVKFRKGFTRADNTAASFALRMAEAGADMITVHGRTTDQMYGGEADWSCIAEVVDALRNHGHRIPVFANGDVTGPESARKILEITGTDGLMIGRAAQGDPWVFERTRAGLLGLPAPAKPSPEQVAAVILEHLDGLIAQLGERVATREMRSQLTSYFRGCKNATGLRRLSGQVATRDDVRDLLEGWINSEHEG